MNFLNDGLSVQINLSPGDYPLAEKLLPEQIAFFGNAADEILLTIETKQSAGRFGENFRTHQRQLYTFLNGLMASNPKIKIVDVDYTPETVARISRLFFNGEFTIPDKDYRGGPFYCYYFGLSACSYATVMHLDSDIILMGNGEKWLPKARKILDDASVLFVNPLPGPPTDTFEIKQNYYGRIDPFTYRFDNVSSRLFLTDLNKLLALKFDPVKLKPSIKNHRMYFGGLLRRNLWQYPEVIMSSKMRRDGLFRVDYWGSEAATGCYSLHPEFKPAHFIEALPALLRALRNDDIPDAQRGRYNVHDDFFDLKKERDATRHPLKKWLGV